MTPNVNTAVGPVTASIHLPLRLGSLDCEHAPIHMLPVEFLFGRVSSFYRIHLDKAEALRATRISICYHDTRFYRPYLGEEVSEFITRGVVREITNKQF